MKAVLITSSILIVLIAASRPILRGKIDPRAQYALWLLVALRLLVPVNLLTSAYSVLALLDRADEPRQIVESIGQTAVPVPAMSYEDALDQAIHEYAQGGNDTSCLDPDVMGKLNTRAQEIQSKQPTLAELAAKYARPVWLGGAALMGLWFLLVNLQLRRKLKRALPVETDCPLPVCVSVELPSPCLCGAFRPKIYVTPNALHDPDRLRHVLAHELTHYRHRDHWWALVRCLCLCLFWFDPLVWWAAALSRHDCELACDEGAIRRLGEKDRIPYGRTLVSMIAAGRTPLMQTATTMTGGKRRVKERVALIARKPKTVIAVALALALIVGCAVGCTFTGAPEEAPSRNLSAETLPERLMDVPEDLQGRVMYNLINDEPSHLADYWLDASDGWIDLGAESGHLLSVCRVSREKLMEQFGTLSYGREWFARSGDDYFVLYRSDLSLPSPSDDPNLLYGYAEAIRAYAMEQVLATDGVESLLADSPAAEQAAIQAAMDNIIGSPSIELTLAPGGTSRVYAYAIPGLEELDKVNFWALRLSAFAAGYDWEYLGEEIRDLPGAPDGDTLRIWTPDGSFIQVWSNSNIILIQKTSGDTAETAYYAAHNPGGDALSTPMGTFSNPGPFQSLRLWFDEVELSLLRTTSVPDRGQSHLEVVEEWLDGFEGAMTKCTPGSMYACTYVRPQNLVADAHIDLSPADLEDFAQDRGNGRGAEDYGKTWFTFSYRLVFVPENETAKEYLEAGNTEDYTGGDAPEGAQIWMRVAYMWLEDGQWVCEGGSTGW